MEGEHFNQTNSSGTVNKILEQQEFWPQELLRMYYLEFLNENYNMIHTNTFPNILMTPWVRCLHLQFIASAINSFMAWPHDNILYVYIKIVKNLALILQ